MDAVVWYKASDMILAIIIKMSYLSKPRSHSRSGVHILDKEN